MLNRYPLWKNLMVIFLVAIGVLYALPNLYGEDPAVQISGTRGQEADSGVLSEVQTVLKDNHLTTKSVVLENGSILVRFDNTDAQLLAKDKITEKLGTNYSVALNLAPATPKWLSSIGGNPMKWGLDLRGGVRFIIRYDELSELLSDPEVIGDTKRFMELTKEEANLRPKVETFKRYQQVVEEISDTEEMLGESLDAEMAEMAKEELSSLKKEKIELEDKIKFLLLPEDPNDGKNIIMEIRGAAGGDEAALFAGDLLNMYQKYAESQGWRVEVMDANVTGIGGYKEVILMITGDNVFSKLKYESGAHRVQRVPSTESQGRVHTSTATVVVMPEAEEVEIELEDKDIRVDIYHASGAGGQHVNKTASAVRLTHLPTGIVVAMQDERSQLKNREKAMKVLRARVYDKISQEAQSEYDANRKSAVGTGDRSERIRTYNFPQNRVTDHRIGLTLQKLDQVLAGKIDEIVDALILYDHTEKLEQLNNGSN